MGHAWVKALDPPWQPRGGGAIWLREAQLLPEVTCEYVKLEVTYRAQDERLGCLIQFQMKNKLFFISEETPNSPARASVQSFCGVVTPKLLCCPPNHRTAL